MSYFYDRTIKSRLFFKKLPFWSRLSLYTLLSNLAKLSTAISLDNENVLRVSLGIDFNHHFCSRFLAKPFHLFFHPYIHWQFKSYGFARNLGQNGMMTTERQILLEKKLPLTLNILCITYRRRRKLIMKSIFSRF